MKKSSSSVAVTVAVSDVVCVEMPWSGSEPLVELSYLLPGSGDVPGASFLTVLELDAIEVGGFGNDSSDDNERNKRRETLVVCPGVCGRISSSSTIHVDVIMVSRM